MIRQARDGDAYAILALWNDVITRTTITFTSTPKTAATVRAMIAEQPVFVAELDGTVAGFSTFAQFRKGDGYAHIMEHSILLDRRAWGRGLGRALMEAVESKARSTGALSLIAGISGENPDAVRFHAALGFVQVAHIPGAGRKFGRMIDLILMQKCL